MGFLVTRLHGGRGYRSPHGTRRDLVDAPAMTDDADLPTARTTLAARYVRVLLTCWHCRPDRGRPWRCPAGAAALALCAVPE